MKKIFTLLAFFLLLVTSPVHAGVIFSDNFDSQTDWTKTQSKVDTTWCWTGDCTPGAAPTGWTGYLNGRSLCSDTAGYNNFYINASPGYPESTGNTCRGGSGKCLTFWSESCAPQFENSDGSLIVDLGVEYKTLYVRWYVRFQPGWVWGQTGEGVGAPQHKFWHIQHYGSGLPWEYFGANEYNQPLVSGGIQVDVVGQYTGIYQAIRGFCGEGGPSNSCYYPNTGTPNYSASWLFNTNDASGRNQLDVDNDYAKRYVYEVWGSGTGKLGDENWHYIELMQQMNTWSGTAWNADGIIKIWIDGILQTSRSNISFNKASGGYNAETNPVRGFRVISLGGNNNNYYAASGDREQWYAIDDVCISTDPIGDGVCGADTTPAVFSNPQPSGQISCASDPGNKTISGITNETATCKYDTSDTTYDLMANTFSTTGGTSHSQSLSLACNAAYTYYVRCNDASGNKNTSSASIGFSIASLPASGTGITLGGSQTLTRGGNQTITR